MAAFPLINTFKQVLFGIAWTVGVVGALAPSMDPKPNMSTEASKRVWLGGTVCSMDAAAEPTWMYSRRVPASHTRFDAGLRA
jgi:hypothetical protein